MNSTMGDDRGVADAASVDESLDFRGSSVGDNIQAANRGQATGMAMPPSPATAPFAPPLPPSEEGGLGGCCCLSAEPPNVAPMSGSELIDMLVADSHDEQAASFLEAYFALHEDSFNLFGAVAVEKAVKLGQCDTLEEVSEYVERHQGDADWRLSLEAIALKESLLLMDQLRQICNFVIEDEFGPRSANGSISDGTRRRRLELLHKIFSKIVRHPHDPKVRQIKSRVICSKLLEASGLSPTCAPPHTPSPPPEASAKLESLVRPLMLSCGFTEEKKVPESAYAVSTTTKRRMEEEWFCFKHALDTDLAAVVRFHKLLSLLEELAGDEEATTARGMDFDTASQGTFAPGEVIVLDDDDEEMEATTASARQAGGGATASNAGTVPSISRDGLAPAGGGLADNLQQRGNPQVPGGRRVPLSTDEMRQKRLAKLTGDSPAGPSNKLAGALDPTSRNRKIAANRAAASVAATSSVAQNGTTRSVRTTANWGGMWRLLDRHSTDVPNIDIRTVPNINNPVFRGEDFQGAGGSSSSSSRTAGGGSRGGHLPGPQALSDRRAQHFTLEDVEKLRWREAIRDTPLYAEQWWNAQPQAKGYTEVQRRNCDPAYLGRRALDFTNRFRGQHGLPPLVWNESMTTIAREHAIQMAKGEMPFSHDGFNQRMARFPFHSYSSAENLAYNQGLSDPAAVAVDGWIKSPGHCKNLLSLTNLCGIGVAMRADRTCYFTQLFAKTSQGLAP
ncbi:unnamed protein product [Amoebophrya sp. A25]|nr:unnamed protein product [Amoebophrya sp. A25]|eukprot:GSA25T00005162001.1